MNDKNDNQFSVVAGTLGFSLVIGLAIFSIASAYQDGYKAGIKDSPATVNVSGDQIITNPQNNFSVGSGNASEARTETGNKEGNK